MADRIAERGAAGDAHGEHRDLASEMDEHLDDRTALPRSGRRSARGPQLALNSAADHATDWPLPNERTGTCPHRHVTTSAEFARNAPSGRDAPVIACSRAGILAPPTVWLLTLDASDPRRVPW